MNKKSITLRLDAASKIILLILSAGVRFMAIKPLTPSSSYAENQGSGLSEQFAPPPWNSLGQNQFMINQGLKELQSRYGYSRLEAYAHFICWEVSAIERRGVGSN